MNRNFYILWSGQLISVVGSQGYSIAGLFWLKHATESTTLMGLLMIASTAPALFLGPIGGVIADRYSRKKIIVLCDLVNALSVLSLSVLLFLIPGKTVMIINWMIGTSIMLSISGAFFRPAISSAIPDLVSKNNIDQANALHQSSSQVSLFIGQGLGGVLYQLLGAPVLFLVDSVTYLYASISGSCVHFPKVTPDKTADWNDLYNQLKTDLREGLRFVWHNAGLRVLIIAFAVLNFLSAPFSILLPFYVEDYLFVGSEWYGFFLAAMGIGTLAGYVVMGAVNLRADKRIYFLQYPLVVMAALITALGCVKTALIALIGCFVVGIMMGLFNLNMLTILQLSTPSDIRGRVFGLIGTFTGALTPLGMGLTGIVADLTNKNLPLIFSVCGGGLLFMSILLMINRDFRTYIQSYVGQIRKDSISEA